MPGIPWESRRRSGSDEVLRGGRQTANLARSQTMTGGRAIIVRVVFKAAGKHTLGMLLKTPRCLATLGTG